MSQLPTRSEIERLVAEKRCLNCGSPLPKVVVPLYQNPLSIGWDIAQRFGYDVLHKWDEAGAGVCGTGCKLPIKGEIYDTDDLCPGQGGPRLCEGGS